MDADVVVVGAGPVGLTLAAELRLGGVGVLVVERLAVPDDFAKAGKIGPLAAEALRRRGLGDRLAEHHEAIVSTFRPGHEGGNWTTHFAAIYRIDQTRQDEPERGYSFILQPDLERLLAENAERLGVEVRREHTVTGLSQDTDGVTLTVQAPGGERTLRAAYVVGCDGGRGAVRRLAGFEFPGTGPVMVCRRADVDLAEPVPRLPAGRLPGGQLFHTPRSLATYEYDGRTDGSTGTLTPDEIAASVRRVTGADVEVTAVHRSLVYTDNARQARTYRDGRVLLAGDAAHVHSPNGAQGLSVGIVDAVNLGWKLAGTVRGWAPGGLLDTYTEERHPVGAAVLWNTRAQTALLRPGPHTDALRRLVADLMSFDEVNRYFGRMMSGLDTRYELPYDVAHPLAGRYAPDLGLGGTENGHAVLADATGAPGVAATAGPWLDRVRYLQVDAVRDDLAAVLLRPDGVVAWAAAPGEPPDLPTLSAALRAWLGEPLTCTFG